MASTCVALVNCVICGQEINEQKPLVGSESMERFKAAVKCFCGLLKEVSVEGFKNVEGIFNGAIKSGDDLKGSEEMCGVACCENCFGVLDEIWRLQEEIDALKASQLEHANGLKTRLLPPAATSTLSSHRVPNILRRSSKRKRDQLTSEPITNSDSPSPKQDRLSTEVIPSAPEEEDDSDSDSYSYQEYVPSTPEPSEGGSDGCDDPEPADAKEIIEAPAKPLGIQEGKWGLRYKKNRQRIPLTDRFYSMTESVLLYKFTLLQSSHGGTQLICLEPGCTTIAQDLDFPSLFAKMGSHVDASHLPGQRPLEPDGKKICPLPNCSQVFGCINNVDFRFHLLVHRQVNLVICDICWKPIQDKGDSLQRHKWTHRNEQEKLGTVPPKRYQPQCPKPPKRSSPPQGPPLWTVLKWEYFIKLADNLLLYKLTPIKIIPSEGLSCQEPDCHSNFLAQGTHYQALEEIKIHVENTHIIFTPGDTNYYPDKPRICPLCPDTFDSGKLFSQHLGKDHAPVGPYICQCCWKPIKDPKYMACHMLTHQGISVKPPKKTGKSICDECGKVMTNSYMTTHKQTHLPDNLRQTFDCDQCPQRFLTGTSLTRHVEQLHVAPDRKRVRSCPICNKGYRWQDEWDFTRHVNTHSNERPYICEICGKAFREEGRLARHQKTVHLEEDKRYQCEFCEMSYKQQVYLRGHLKKVHKDKVAPPRRQICSRPAPAPESRRDFIGPKIAFPCEFCGKVLPMKCRLTQHIKKYHASE